MNGETNIADLVRKLRDDILTLLREEVALAKTEVSKNLLRTGRHIGSLAIGGLVAFSAMMLILMALGYLLSELFANRGVEPGVSVFLGFLIIAIIVGAISALLIAKALKCLSGNSIVPEKTVQSLREDKVWAQKKLSS